MCQIKLAACLSVFQCKSSILSYCVVSYSHNEEQIKLGENCSVCMRAERCLSWHYAADWKLACYTLDYTCCCCCWLQVACKSVQ